MKNVLLVLAISLSINAYSQKEDIQAKLKDLGISEDFLAHNLKDEGAKFSFSLTTTTNTETSTQTTTEVEECHFDPTQPVGSKWTLDKHDSRKPQKSELKNFDKAHNTKEKEINGKVEDTSWKIKEDNDQYLVINFKYEKESLPKKYDYLGDCVGTAYINKSTKALEKVEFINEGPIKIKFFHVTDLKMVTTFLSLNGQFLMKKSIMDITAVVLGQTAKVEDVLEYSNYKKVK